MPPDQDPWDATIVGAGPAGVSCAIWLKRLGLRPLLIEARSMLGGLTAGSPYPNPWVATSPGVTGVDLAAALTRSVADAGVDVKLGTSVADVSRLAAVSGAAGTTGGEGPERPAVGGFRLSFADGGHPPLAATTLVVASGVRPRDGGLAPRPEILIGPGRHVLDHDFRGLRVAILGGGDNALEHFAIISGRGAAALDVFARTLRAQKRWLDATPRKNLHVGPYRVDDRELTVAGRPYDRLLVFYGYAPVADFTVSLGLARDAAGYLRTDSRTAETSAAGVYAIGEVANRLHPSVVTAMADGVTAAKAIQRRLGR